MAKNSRVVAVATPSLYEKLDNRAQQQQRLDDAVLEFMHAQETVRAKNSELIEINTEIGGYTSAEGRLIDQRYQARLVDARARSEKTQSALKAAREKSSALKDEIDGLQRELIQSRDGITSSGEVTSYQRDVEAARTEVARIESFLEEQRQIRANARARLQSDDRSAERASLAAGVSLGELSEQRLKEFDAETAKQQEAMDGIAAEVLPVIEAADSAIAGLEHRLEAARGALAELEAKGPPVITMYLHSLAKAEGERYLEIARELRDSYLKLMALDRLLGGAVITSNTSQPLLTIPNFYLKAHEPLGTDWEKWTFYRAVPADFAQAREQLIEQLQALGVQISS